MRARKLLSRPFVIVAVIAAVAGAASLSQLGGAAGATAVADTIVYNQQTGANGTYIQYVPGDGSKVTKQAVTSGGGCATPSPSGVPLLAFSAKSYPNGYADASTSAIVGAYKSRTGVCATPQAWSIEVNEGLIFSVGSNTLTAGRQWSRAQLQIEREDKSLATDPPAVVQVVRRVGATVVDTQSFSIAGPSGHSQLVDTGEGIGFDSIEIRVLSPAAGSVSVVGPTSTFTFAKKICPGDTITDTSTGGTLSSGEVTANFTFVSAPGGACKSYSFFEALSTDPNVDNGKSVEFLSQQLAGAHMTATFDWGLFPYCRPDNNPDPAHPGAPECPATTVDFGSGDVVQTFCAPNGASTAVPWCTTSRHFDYVQDPSDSSVTLVHITETWDGLGDILFRRG
jgi:hypothetical protein